jgi:hypothetical protein
VLEFSFARHLTPARLALLALGALAAALLVLIAGGGRLATAAVFAMLLGMSNGVMTIVRGIVPAALFGRDRLAVVLGVLGRPTLAARAAAPLLVSTLIATVADVRYTLALLALIAAGAIVTFRLIPPADRVTSANP